MCRTHGVPGRFDPDAWVNPRRAPPYYPDAVTLAPTASGPSLLERIDTIAPDCSIKDSFATLDLGPFGFSVVHEADWICREPQASAPAPSAGVRWIALQTATDLSAWASAWDGHGAPDGLFRPALLRDPSVTILGGFVDGSVVAGAIANRTGDDIVGLSNVFASDGDLEGAWSGSLGYLATAFPAPTIVGYATGQALAIAHRRGFRSAGLLRVWSKDD